MSAPTTTARLQDDGTGIDQARTPLADLLREEVAAAARWTVPGHMGGRCAPVEALDLLGTRVHAADLWPDQALFTDALLASEELAAQAWGADRAFLLTAGATSGNLAWIFATLQPGDTVVVDSACHVSVLTGLALRAGVRPVWIQRDIDAELGIPLPIDPAVLARVLREHPEARQVVVTSPTYSGTASPLATLADLTHAAGAVLYVDAAWAPHGRWVPGGALDPMAAGADGAVVSLHKTGAALSGAAVLQVGAGLGGHLRRQLVRTVEGLRSTSPLLPVLVSSDLARAAMATAGADGLRRAEELADDLRARCDRVPGVRVLRRDDAGTGPSLLADPMKLVLDVQGTGHTGFAVQRLLRAGGAIVEGADLQRLYLVLPAWVPPGRYPGDLSAQLAAHEALVRAFDAAVAIPPSRGAGLRLSPTVWAASRGRQVMAPAQARAAATVDVPLHEAAGRVAAEHAAPYPPGVPVWVPGEEITEAAVTIVRDVLAAGGEIHGPSDVTGATVAVLT